MYACGQGACRSEPLSDVVRVGDVKSNSCQYSAIEAADWALSTIKSRETVVHFKFIECGGKPPADHFIAGLIAVPLRGPPRAGSTAAQRLGMTISINYINDIFLGGS